MTWQQDLVTAYRDWKLTSNRDPVHRDANSNPQGGAA